MAFVEAIYHRIGGRRMTDKLERWAIESPEVDKLDTSKRDNIYAGLPVWTTRMVNLFGIGSTIRVNQQLIGSDKIGHFLSQGRKFYRRYLKYGSEEQAAKQSVFTERAIFGSGSTGSFSNADLVANYEGYRFYRSLFEDNVIPGKPAIVRWEDDGWVIQRGFDWADHVNEYWDEALNINDYDGLLYKHMRERLVNLCPQYWAQPALYTIDNEEALKTRYARLGMRDSNFLRLDNLCLSEEATGGRTTLATRNNSAIGRGASREWTEDEWLIDPRLGPGL
ncbi:MAG: hypothetical protein ACE5KS_00125 [Woeseiaceae bacterium]